MLAGGNRSRGAATGSRNSAVPWNRNLPFLASLLLAPNTNYPAASAYGKSRRDFPKVSSTLGNSAELSITLSWMVSIRYNLEPFVDCRFVDSNLSIFFLLE
jgi:hypothetical protein